MTVQISAANLQTLTAMTGGTKVPVSFQFAVIEYDPIQRKYFKSCSSGTAFNGFIDSSTTSTSFSLASQATLDVATPANYALKLAISPTPTSQNVVISMGAGKNINKPWAA